MRSQQRQRSRCRVCGKAFSARVGTPLYRIACAREIGMQGLHLQHNAATAEPNVIRSLAEIPEHLRLL